MARTSYFTPRSIVSSTAAFALCTLAGMSCAPAVDPPPFGVAVHGEQLVPPGAKVTLEVDRPEYVIGENVLVHFVLENTGTEPFETSWGGDYRRAGRPNRFKVTATDENGRVAADPHESLDDGGGLMSMLVQKPGDQCVSSLQLMRYCDIDKAGVYTVSATHDFGWTAGKRKRPAGECTIRFRMPDAAEAERVVSEMEKLSFDYTVGPNKRWPAFGDFACLRLPVYVEPLMRRALEGNSRAVDGIAGMPTLEATEALIRLAEEGNAKTVASALRALNARLPIQSQMETRLVKSGWDAKLEPAIRALAKKLLERNETPAQVTSAAGMIQIVGQPEDAPAAFAALDRAMEQTTGGDERRDPDDNIVNFPQPMQQLVNALGALQARGYRPEENLTSPAHTLMYFDRLEGKPLPRPPDWMKKLQTFGRDGNYAIREAALRSVPQPMPAECKELVLQGLTDEDLGVCRAACNVAGGSGDRDFLKPLLAVVESNSHDWLVRDARGAAEALGAGKQVPQAR